MSLHLERIWVVVVCIWVRKDAITHDCAGLCVCLTAFSLSVYGFIISLNMFMIILSSAGQPGESFHFFNLSSFGRDERMIKAQFRWFRKKRKFYPGRFHTPHFYKVNASCLFAFKGISFSHFFLILYRKQKTLVRICGNVLEHWR